MPRGPVARLPTARPRRFRRVAAQAAAGALARCRRCVRALPPRHGRTMPATRVLRFWSAMEREMLRRRSRRRRDGARTRPPCADGDRRIARYARWIAPIGSCFAGVGRAARAGRGQPCGPALAHRGAPYAQGLAFAGRAGCGWPLAAATAPGSAASARGARGADRAHGAASFVRAGKRGLARGVGRSGDWPPGQRRAAAPTATAARLPVPLAGAVRDGRRRAGVARWEFPRAGC